MIAKATLLKSAGAVLVVGAGLGLLAVNLPQDDTKVNRPDSSVTPSPEASPTLEPSKPPAPPTAEPQPEPVPTEQPPFSRDVQEDPPTKEPITLYPTTNILDQGAIDRGGLVTWYTDPLILAGHQNTGWDFLDDIPVGTTVVVANGPAYGAYIVEDSSFILVGQDHYVSELPYGYDLYLQTCIGDYGFGYSLLRRLEI